MLPRGKVVAKENCDIAGRFFVPYEYGMEAEFAPGLVTFADKAPRQLDSTVAASPWWRPATTVFDGDDSVGYSGSDDTVDYSGDYSEDGDEYDTTEDVAEIKKEVEEEEEKEAKRLNANTFVNGAVNQSKTADTTLSNKKKGDGREKMDGSSRPRLRLRVPAQIRPQASAATEHSTLEKEEEEEEATQNLVSSTTAAEDPDVTTTAAEDPDATNRPQPLQKITVRSSSSASRVASVPVPHSDLVTASARSQRVPSSFVFGPIAKLLMRKAASSSSSSSPSLSQ